MQNLYKHTNRPSYLDSQNSKGMTSVWCGQGFDNAIERTRDTRMR